jgi:hypothetical protein
MVRLFELFWSDRKLSILTRCLVEVDFLPDVSQYPTNCLFTSTLTAPNGQPVQLYDNTCEGVVDLHFKWMQQYGIDGTIVQRFLSHLSDASFITVSLYLSVKMNTLRFNQSN